MTDQPSAQHASRSEAIDRTLAEFRASRRGEPGVVIARGDGESLDCSVVFPFEMTPVCTPNRTRISWYAADVLFVSPTARGEVAPGVFLEVDSLVTLVGTRAHCLDALRALVAGPSQPARRTALVMLGLLEDPDAAGVEQLELAFSPGVD